MSITNPCQMTELRYNRQNYLTYVKDGNGNEVRRTYDHMGNLTAYLPPNQGADGTAWMYRYDFFDRLIEARDPLGNSWKQERNLAGDVLSKTGPTTAVWCAKGMTSLCFLMWLQRGRVSFFSLYPLPGGKSRKKL